MEGCRHGCVYRCTNRCICECVDRRWMDGWILALQTDYMEDRCSEEKTWFCRNYTNLNFSTKKTSHLSGSGARNTLLMHAKVSLPW